MKIKYLALAFIILFFSSSIYGQKFGQVRGQVSDSSNGEALAFVNVYFPQLNRGTTTDTKGYFVITGIPFSGNYEVQFSYLGYEKKVVLLAVRKNMITDYDVYLSPTTLELQTVTKIGKREVAPNATDLGLDRIPIQEIERHPRGVETDIFRSLQYLPGVQAVGDVSARYYVRGGASNQNLVLLDGVPIYNPFHALGIFSIIDPEIINSMEFFKSGFPAEDGGRLSSVLKVFTKEGNRFNYGGKASLSMLTYKGLVEGPIPNGSFVVSGRKSHSKKILKKFLNNKNAPFDFYDFSFRVNYQNIDPKFVDDSKFTFHGFFSRDNLASSDPYTEDYKWTNNILGFKRFQIYDSPLHSEMSIAVSNFDAEVNPKLSDSRAMKNSVEDASMRMDFAYIYDSQDELNVGAGFKTVKTSLLWLNRRGVFTEYSKFGANISLYAKYKFLRFKNFGLDAGLRYNFISLNDQGNFRAEPRINLTYRIIPEIAFKASWGLYEQGITTITDENDVVSLFEPWFITPDNLKSARSIHYNAGLDFNFANWVEFSTEGYYKSMTNLPVVNLDKKLITEPDFIPGEGESYGAEFLLKFITNSYTLTSSYSVSWAYQEVNNEKFFPRYDSRHNFKTLLEINFGNGWLGGITWNFHTGHPFTPTSGYYDKLFLDDVTNLELLESYYPFTLLGQRNIHRLPDYHRLDLTLSKRFTIYFLKFTADLSVLNVYDRKNLFYFERDTGDKVNMLPFLTSGTLKLEI